MGNLIAVNNAMLTGEELGRAIESARRRKGVSKAELARIFGVKPPSVQGWVKHGRISKDKLEELISYFSDVADETYWGRGKKARLKYVQGTVLSLGAVSEPRAMNEYSSEKLKIPRLDVSASMGPGVTASMRDDVIEEMSVSRDWLHRNVSPTAFENLALIDGRGDSMEGTFSDGDLLLVDRGIESVKVDAVYVLALGDDLFIKRLQRRPDGTMLMLSDNSKYPPYEIKNGDMETFHVLGRVLLAWNARRL